MFGIIKHVMGFRQFSLRGLDAVAGEWTLVTLAFNYLLIRGPVFEAVYFRFPGIKVESPVHQEAGTITPVALENHVEEPGSDEVCNSEITVEQLGCLNHEFETVNHELNRIYKEVMSRLGGNDKAALKRAQIAWIKEKESRCSQAGKEVEGGSLEPILIVDCMIQMTRDRISYIAAN